MPRTADDCARFSVIGTWTNARPVVNVFEYTVQVAASFSRAQALQQQAELIRTAWTTHILPIMADNYNAVRVDYLDLDNVAGPTGSAAFTQPAPGTQAAASSGPANARRLTKVLAGAPRGVKRGQMFLAGVSESAVDENGIWTGASTTGPDGFLADSTVDIAVNAIAGSSMVVIAWPSISVAQPVKKVPNPDGVGTPHLVTGWVAQTLITTQRRRAGL